MDHTAEDLKYQSLWEESLQNRHCYIPVTPLLIKSWISALKHEMRLILFQYKISNALPSIQIDHSLKRWGQWQPRTRTILISQHLLLHFSWDSVIETLKHELAHMLTDDSIPYGSEPPHGPTFKKYCRQLGISTKAAASDADMGLPLDSRNNDSYESPLMDRIRKLLALSESSNENEAFVAMKKANEIILKYNLDSSFSETHHTCEYRQIGEKKLRRSLQETIICNLLKDFFFVDYLIIPSFLARTGKNITQIEILGLPENLDMAEYVFYYLLKQTELLWKKHQAKSNTKGKSEKKSYQTGLLEGFRSTLETSFPAVHQNALIKLQEKELHDFLQYRHPRIRHTKKSGGLFHEATYHQGRQDGHFITLNRPLKASASNPLLFLNDR